MATITPTTQVGNKTFEDAYFVLHKSTWDSTTPIKFAHPISAKSTRLRIDSKIMLKLPLKETFKLRLIMRDKINTKLSMREY